MLSGVRIAPRLGNWELNEVMTPELTTRLRTLTVSAAQRGWLTVTPEQALLAFDTAAALLGINIPILTGKSAPAAPLLSVQVPPLIYLSPPPAPVYSFYSWVPITGGFFWRGVNIHGFFALHGLHLKGHFFNDHHFVFAPHIIEHHFVSHFVGHSIIEHHPQQHFVKIHTTGGRHFATTSRFTSQPTHTAGSRAHLSPARPARALLRPARTHITPHVESPVHAPSQARVSGGSRVGRLFGLRTHGSLHSGSFGHGGGSGHSGGHSGGH